MSFLCAGSICSTQNSRQCLEFCPGAIMEEALNQFYTSQTFSKLIDQETGLYLDASASVYALYQDELEAGELVQNEI